MMTERLIHFSNHVITEVHGNHNSPGNWKPKGFWVSVEGNGDGWSDWCRDNEWGTDRLANAHEVTLADSANILWIRSVEELDAFAEQWKIQPDWNDPIQRKWHHLETKIDWEAVAHRWRGIIITPHLWERRLDGGAFWYYGWDCASGCIWDPAAIASIQLLQEANQ
jgi:hypothetical protein